MDAAQQSRSNQKQHSPAPDRAETLRKPLLRILFLHSRVADIERCLRELEKVHFQIAAEVVLTAEQFAEHLRSKYYDVVLAEYPPPQWHGAPILELLHKENSHIPLIFVTGRMERETVADLIIKGVADCVEMDNLGHLPIAIRRALHENTLRQERDRAERKFQHSEAHYRALVGNLAYGICRCGREGEFLGVNQAMVTMLGCASEEDLLGVNLATDILCDPSRRAQLLGHSGEEGRVDPLEVEWKRRDGAHLKLRLSGREVSTEEGKSDGYEIIAEDVTKQRELENDLREEAAKDSLTGLANYQCFVGALDGEIKRSQRTGREFALLLFDLDRLKKINDRYGHVIGSQALCRLADVLGMGCRDIDIVARFGGDEFAVILPETGAAPANFVAQRLCDSLANDGRRPKLSVSVGQGVYPQDGKSIEDLLVAADLKLYAMKTRVHSTDRPTRVKAMSGHEITGGKWTLR